MTSLYLVKMSTWTRFDQFLVSAQVPTITLQLELYMISDLCFFLVIIFQLMKTSFEI